MVVLAVGAAAVFFLRPNIEKIDINRGEPSGQVAPVPQAMTRTFNEDNGRYTVTVEYPELQGISAPGVREKVNGAIKTGVYNQIAAFQAANASNMPLGEEDFKSSFDGQFDVSLLTASFFSGIMTYSDYSSGAAHANSYNVALNYNLKTGEAVTLGKLFESLGASSGYMSRLGAYARRDLIRQFGDGESAIGFIDFGSTPTAENYANFTLNEQGLSIHFDPYQVAPYAAGSPTIAIPYDEFNSEIVKASGTEASATSSVEWWLE